MKKLFIAALAALSFVACSKDNAKNNDGVKEGVPTSVSLKITQEGVDGTRAPKPVTDGAVGQENVITGNKVHVLVFNSSNNLEYVNNFILAGNNTGTFQITSGTKYFVVMANLPASIDTYVSGLTPGAVSRTTFEQATYTLLATTNAAQEIADPAVSPASNFFMTNLYTTSQAVVAGVNPTIPVKIGRVTAKVTPMITATNVEQEVNGIPTVVGTFSDPRVKLGSYAVNTFRVGQLNSGGSEYEAYRYSYNYVANPNDIWGAAPTYPGADFIRASATYEAITAAPGPIYYTLESSHATPLEGNSTRLILRGEFAPAAAYVYDATSTTGAAGTIPGSKTFYVAVDGGSIIQGLFFDAQPANAAVVDGAITAAGLPAGSGVYTYKEYTNGLCYYNKLFLMTDEAKLGTKPSEALGVYRNHHYKATITKVNGVGYESEDGNVNPVTPVVQSSDVDLTITVLDWSGVDQNIVAE